MAGRETREADLNSSYDVVVVGAGLAGLVAAAELGDRGKRVLVVDDNETNRRILDVQTQAWGMQCLLATSGPEALRALAEEAKAGRAIDVAIFDMQMPDMDGAMLAQRVHDDPHWRDLPLMLLSSATGLLPSDDTRRPLFDCQMMKPVRQAQLKAHLIRLVQKHLEPAASEAGADVTTANAKPIAEADDGAPDFSQLRVLIAEDNPVNQLVAKRQLERLGIEPTTVDNGAEAIAACESAAYDVVLMDCMMPELDGYE
ncbi:MAG: response regulator, partial [Hyphomicrobiales bacterium]|nr:response regulator [Hyphomicrobiales bacterium]